MIDRLKREAARRALLYQSLIHTWLKERLDAETREPGHEHGSRAPRLIGVRPQGHFLAWQSNRSSRGPRRFLPVRGRGFRQPRRREAAYPRLLTRWRDDQA